MSRTNWLRLVAFFATSLGSLGAVCATEAAPAKAAAWWLVRPSQVEPQIVAWAAKYPKLVSLDSLKTFDGHTAYAITVTGPASDHMAKCNILFSQPHAHEPASTAGMMDFLSQLLDGRHLDGQPTALNRDELLAKTVLTFIPLGNPDGRARAPENWWDGHKYNNDDFMKIAFGREADGTRPPRVGRFSIAKHRPVFIGIAYERINSNEYVEPNRDTDSTYFKLLHRAMAKREYSLILDLHQSEFEQLQENAETVLILEQANLPEAIRATNLRVAQAIIAAWQKAGAHPIAEPDTLGYREDQLRYFRKCWSDICRTTPFVLVEVQNNNVRTPPRAQMQLTETAILTAINTIIANPAKAAAIKAKARATQ